MKHVQSLDMPYTWPCRLPARRRSPGGTLASLLTGAPSPLPPPTPFARVSGIMPKPWPGCGAHTVELKALKHRRLAQKQRGECS